MKNQIFLSLLSFFFFLNANAQDEHHGENHEKTIYKINFLLIPFAEFAENAKVDYVMGPELMIERKNTHHHFGYEMRSGSINTLQGLIFNHEYGVYGFFQKKLKKDNHHDAEEHPDHILSLGFERFFLGKELDRIIYFEVGTNFHKPIFSFGMVMELHILKF